MLQRMVIVTSQYIVRTEDVSICTKKDVNVTFSGGVEVRAVRMAVDRLKFTKKDGGLLAITNKMAAA